MAIVVVVMVIDIAESGGSDGDGTIGVPAVLVVLDVVKKDSDGWW